MGKINDTATLLSRVGAQDVAYRSFDASPMPEEQRGGWRLFAALDEAPPPAAEPDGIVVTEELPIACTEAVILPLEDEVPAASRPTPRAKPLGAMFRRTSPASEKVEKPGGTALGKLFERLG